MLLPPASYYTHQHTHTHTHTLFWPALLNFKAVDLEEREKEKESEERRVGEKNNFKQISKIIFPQIFHLAWLAVTYRF